MRKLIVLALKEVKLTFRDVGAVLLVIITPLILTLAVVAAFGQGGSGAISDVPVVVVNQDEGALGQGLIELFQSDELKNLLALRLMQETALARAEVDAGKAAAAVIIPPDFTLRLTGEGADSTGEPALQLYGSPSHPVGVSVVNSIVERFVEQATLAVQGRQMLVQEMINRNIVNVASEQELANLNAALDRRLSQARSDTVRVYLASSEERAFNWLSYFAPSMALLFLMFYAITAGRTLLDERQTGTLPRLLVSPTLPGVILVGKMSGILITGLMQMLILWGLTTLIGAYWGAAGPVVVSLLVVVLAATGLGALIAAWSRTPAQANALGIMIVLISAALAGNFLPRMNLPGWMQSASLITPNGWGLELLMRLQAGAGFQEILPLLGGVCVLSVVYYALATLGFRRQFA